MPDLIDTHCHLDDDRFDDDRDQVIARAHSEGVLKLVIPATTAQRWPKIRQISQQYTEVYAAYGLHPMFMGSHQYHHLQELDEWLGREQSIAVGECGLDFYESDEGKENQILFFKSQLDIARNHGLPVIIHARKSLDMVLHEIRQTPNIHGVVHSFGGSLQQAQQLFDLGFKLGIGANLSFERAKKLRQVVKSIDIKALLLESDAPDQAGAFYRGRRNEPAFITHHLKVMAEIRELNIDELTLQLTNNAEEIFKINSL